MMLGVGAMSAGAVALSMLGAGTAAANTDVVGQTFKDAKAALSQAGLGVTVASTLGDRKDWDSCIVTSASKASFKDSSGNSTGNNVLVNLNCYAKYATPSWPGFSMASPEGQKIYKADLAAKQKREAEQAAQQQAAEGQPG
jgi:hypothetical protein